MNKVTLTIESDDPAFLRRITKALRVDETVAVTQADPTPIQTPESQAPAQEPAEAVAAQPPAGSGPSQEEPQPKRTRKPRADAGKPRGSYKDSGAQGAATDGTAAAAAATPTATAGEVAQQAPAAQPAGSIPAADTLHAEIEARNAAARASVNTGTAPKKLTHDDIRTHLAQLNKIPGLGMGACHAFLHSFVPTGAAVPGVARISDVPEADFVRFMAEVDARIAKFKVEGK